MTDKNSYAEAVKKASPSSPKLKNCIKAFLSGGTVCLIGQILRTVYIYLGMSTDNAKIAVSTTLIVLTAILTGTGVFDKIAKHAGAGTVVPITGFANAVAAPAVEYRTEGRIFGVGSNMFKIAGPVIVYGTAAAFIYGLIYFCFGGFV